MSKNTRNRILLTALAALLLVTLTIGGTMAWLVDTTGQVQNTFTTAGIDIDLTETIPAGETTWSMQMIPGTTKTKNPVVSVIRPETDVDIYLFVEFAETVDETVVTYTSNLTDANGWLKDSTLPANVWYRIVEDEEELETACTATTCELGTAPHWHLLLNDTVSVANGVTKDMIPDTQGTMTYKAYAIQKDNTGSISEAWAKISNPTAQ